MTESLTYIFDIDGTLTAERYYNDEVSHLIPNRPIVGLALSVANSSFGRVAVVTARPEYLRGPTEEWLTKQGIHPEILLMRNNSDIRPDQEVRVDQVKTVLDLFGNYALLLDDKLSNCLAVKSCLEVPCIHIRKI